MAGAARWGERPVTATLLLLEDNRNLRLGLKALFEMSGLEVAPFGTVAEATALLSGPAANVAVVDLYLPDGSGADFAAILRRTWPRCPVFLLTASTELPPASPGVHVVAKPFDPGHLVTEVLEAAGLSPRDQGP